MILRKIRNTLKSDVTLIVVMIIMFSTILVFGLFKTISEKDCDILACKYENKIMPILNIVGLLFFLPTVIAVLLNWLNPYTVILSIIATVLYWFFIAFVLTKIYETITKKSTKIINETPKDKIMSMTNISIYLIILFPLFMGIMAFLYYPDINVRVRFEQYLILATAIVVISTYLLNVHKGKSAKDYQITKGIKSLTHASIYFLIMGAFTSFMFSNRVPPITESILDSASTSAFQYATMAGGLIGLIFIYLIAMEGFPVKKKTKK